MRLPLLKNIIAAWVAVTASALLPARGEVVISEFLAENDSGLADVDGAHSDWIELYNNGGAAVNLAGWYLTDDVQTPLKWPLPNFSINAGERRVY